MNKIHSRFAVTLVTLVISIAFFSSAAVAQIGDVAVVVNQKNQVDNLNITDLRKIFSGEKRSWTGGQPIRLFVRAPHARERAVLLKLLQMDESEYKRHWAAKVFRGEAQFEPIAMFSNGMQKEAVFAYPGAIVLMMAEDVKPGMKMLKIAGRMPGDSGYPLN